MEMNTLSLTNYAAPIIEFQKNAFNSTFDTMVNFQDQAITATTDYFEQNNSIPSEGQQYIEQWAESIKTMRNDFRTRINEGFDNMLQMCENNPAPAKSKK